MKAENGFIRFDTEEEFKTWLKNKSISRTEKGCYYVIWRNV